MEVPRTLFTLIFEVWRLSWVAWVILEAMWGCLGLSWVILGAILGLSWPILAETGFIYERSEGFTGLNDSWPKRGSFRNVVKASQTLNDSLECARERRLLHNP